MNTSIDTSFVSWLYSLIESHVLDQFLVFMAFGLIGAIAHFIKKKYIEKEIQVGFWEYVVVKSPDRTLLTISSLLIACVGYLTTGVVASTTWPALIGMAFTTGFSLNSSFNKGK